MEAEAEAGSGGSSPFSVEGRIKRKNLVLLTFVEEQIGGAYTLRNENEEESFREMLTST